LRIGQDRGQETRVVVRRINDARAQGNQALNLRVDIG
jgi:hypothetical protein